MSRSRYQPHLLQLPERFLALIDEWIKAADYIVQAGNDQVILCERGIRSFESKMRNTLDLATVAYMKQHYDFPVIVDPSHGTGHPELIPPMTKAAIACGADGIMVEVHPNPKEALSDGFQALTYEDYKAVIDQIQPYLQLANRSFAHG